MCFCHCHLSTILKCLLYTTCHVKDLGFKVTGETLEQREF